MVKIRKKVSVNVARQRPQAEARRRRSRRNCGACARADLPKLVWELQTQQAELDMKNEELRRVQADLEASREHYLELYENAARGYRTLDVTLRDNPWMSFQNGVWTTSRGWRDFSWRERDGRGHWTLAKLVKGLLELL